ncbi:error-prone DNA polymerase [Inmirania thermothiophila]|uniref:Error-prone DNA polymerase n=1 Tax=Inmirania thermothiophila TaxID=1750597 RepID=A0A3N1Y0L1_9GAMM|nr:error-prone DNA polymerase [Inmirania thermothiophila]ROR32374.1 error-prone DNA polymerase [Inmirania thermothiophila]
MAPPYAELHCLSNFTFLRGASHPEELVARAAALGYAALAITDECSLAGVVRAHRAAREHGLHLIVGSEIALEDGPSLVILATDRAGYGRLSALVTRGRRRAPKGRYRLARADLADGLPGCLVLLLPEDPPEPEHAAWVAATFPGRAWIAVELHLGGDDAARLAALQRLGTAAGLPLVAAGGAIMHVRARRALADALTAIRLRRPLPELGHALAPNGERHLRRREVLARLYPAPLLAETVRIAARCRFSLDALRYEYPEELVPPGETPSRHLARLTWAGARRRWPDGIPERVRRQIEHELALIAELRYEPYFLTVHDIVRFARGRGILCQGRGSAANSAVCYCLGITEVDPARMETLFERFVSRERDEPPDIDVDFEHERREEVIQYIYRKYGRDRAALAASVITYRPRSAVRDLGFALGIDRAQIDRLAKNLAWWDRGRGMTARIAEVGLDPASPVLRRLLALVDELVGFPRHLSQHVGGFVISRGPLPELVPVENAAMPQRTVIQWDKDDLDALGLLKVDVLALGMLTALRKTLALTAARGGPARLEDIPPEDPATYEMIARADTVGVFQIESRAQMAMLPRLRPRCFYDLVIQIAIVRPGPIQGDMVHPYLRRRQGLEPVDYPSEAVRRVLGRTLGVPIFQEQVIRLAMVAAGFSAGEADRLRRAMAAWRRKGELAPFRERLLAGMRERGYAPEFAERIFRQIQGFGEYGFPESHAASFALLAYASAWLKRHHPAAFFCALLNSQPMGFYAPAQLVRDARRHGVEVRPVDVTASHWDCTLEDPPAPEERAEQNPTLPAPEERAEHSPVLPASQGASGRGTSLPAPRGGSEKGTPLPASRGGPGRGFPLPASRGGTGRGQPQNQHRSFAPLPASRGGTGRGPALRLGLRLVKGLGEAAARRIEAARAEAPFTDVDDLARRARLDRRALAALAEADALRRLAGHRRRARWQILGADPDAPPMAPPRATPPPPLAPAPEGEEIVADYAATGLSLRRHPLALLRGRLRRLGWRRTAALALLRDGDPARIAGLVVTRQRPGSASGVVFLTLEDESGQANVILRPRLVERERRAVLGARLLAVSGKIQREGEVVHLLARRIEDLSPLLGALPVASRDFH